MEGEPVGKFREYLLKGIRNGFRIGFKYGSWVCKSAKANMKSAADNLKVVDDYLAKEAGLGRVLGALDEVLLPSTIKNRFEVIPKNHQPGKWRLIVDLSHVKE